MPVDKEYLEQILQEKFPEAKIEITDLVGDGNHYSLVIADKIFANKTRVAQHKIVNSALASILGTELHALQIKTSDKL